MLRCWACRLPLRPKAVRRDGIIRGREPARGGPFREYRCPRCFKHSKIEENRRGELFSSPPKEMSVLDYLFGWIEPLAPEDFLRILEWQGANGEARRHFFEDAGDRRYSGGIVRRLYARLRRSRCRSRPSRDPPSKQRAPTRVRAPGVPHPYRILGIEPGASEEEVRAAFHQLARKWHPDKQRDPSKLEEATRRWKELVRAYEAITRRR